MDVYGAEPAGADDAQRSLRSGIRQSVGVANTIADGLRTSIGEKPFEVIRQHVRDIATVSDDEIIQAMKLIWHVLKIIIEPSCAVPVAALMTGKLPAGRTASRDHLKRRQCRPGCTTMVSTSTLSSTTRQSILCDPSFLQVPNHRLVTIRPRLFTTAWSMFRDSCRLIQ